MTQFEDIAKIVVRCDSQAGSVQGTYCVIQNSWTNFQWNRNESMLPRKMRLYGEGGDRLIDKQEKISVLISVNQVA